jgi:glycosyltransferase 2 family protein
VLRSRTIVLQAAVSALALAAVVWWAAHQPLPRLPDARTALPGIGAGLVLYALATALRGERWRRLLGDGGMACPRGDAYALITIGYMGNNALPARAGDVMKGLLSARRVAAPGRDALGVVVAERTLDVVALSLLFAGLVATLRLPLGIPGWVPAVVAAGLFGAAGAAWRLGRRTATGEHVRETVAALLAPSRRLWSRRGVAMLGVSVALWLVEGGVYAVLGAVAGVPLTFVDGLYVMALANVAALVPSAPGYVGTFDAAVLLGVGLVAAAAHPAALAYVVLVRFVLFVPITLVGLGALVTRYGGPRRVEALRPASP